MQLLVRFGGVMTALDSDTRTGYSAEALAEAWPQDGWLVTLERE